MQKTTPLSLTWQVSERRRRRHHHCRLDGGLNDTEDDTIVADLAGQRTTQKTTPSLPTWRSSEWRSRRHHHCWLGGAASGAEDDTITAGPAVQRAAQRTTLSLPSRRSSERRRRRHHRSRFSGPESREDLTGHRVRRPTIGSLQRHRHLPRSATRRRPWDTTACFVQGRGQA